ncbi:hypothetical protein SAMN05421773_10479 [Streptomyces aidingensis]|uniref:Uncharacterized protein n=1 Tax=Streptomyces aidingensis TaxID=910347 RepID=A0A1I1K3S2_9ACTN|nr:hypothetical protein SAMN05421773_10479 [Streptomyces aidingensis]
MTLFVDGYWCEVVARSPEASGEWFLSGYRANSPRLAVRWLRGQAARLANALDPKPGIGPIPPECLWEIGPSSPNPGRIFREWMEDFRYQGTQMETLAAGRPISVNAGGPDRIFGFCDADVFYSLSARPIAVDFVTDWRLSELSHAAA